jgi:MFS family permease
VLQDLFALLFGVFATIFIYSFLWKENPLSRAIEHLFVGMAAVYTLAAMYDAALSQAVWGTTRIEGGYYIWVIPILISFMYFFFFTKKYFYLYRYPVSIVVGIMAGMMICGMIQSNFLAQIQSTAVNSVLVGDGVWEWTGGSTGIVGLNSLIVIIGTITALTFFFFTWEHKGVLGISTKIGRYVLMATFGASYGSTVMARISLFIGRLRFLYEASYTDEAGWLVNAWYILPIAIICVVIMALWVRSRPEEKPPEPAPKPEKPKPKG